MLGSHRLDDELLHTRYLEHVAPELTGKTVVAVDMTDIAKPYSVAQEGLGEVWDGSKQAVHDRGWPVLGIEAVPPGRGQIPLYLKLYSRAEADYVSDNSELRRGIERVAPYVPEGCLWVLDRGFDGTERFKILDDFGIEWAVRLKGDRDVVAPGGIVRNVEALSRDLELPYQATFTSIQKRRKIEYSCRFGYIRVSIPGSGSKRLSLVVAWFRSARSGRMRSRPTMLLTVRDVRSEAGALEVIRGYTERWGIEETYRGVKSYFDLEDLRVMTLRRIKRLVKLAAMAQGFLGLLATKGRRWAVRLVERLTKNFGAAPRYLFYQLRDAASKVLLREGLARRWASPGAVRLRR